MEFSKIVAPTLKELFIEQLENLILSGSLAIGEKLPPERELAESMQVSRAVVNEGIGELARKGFLTIRPRVGTFVADYRTNGTIETLTAVLKYNGGIVKEDEIRSTIELKVAINTLAVNLCIHRLTDDDLTSLRLIVKALKTVQTVSEAAELTYEFHHRLAVLSGNTLLPMIVASFQMPIKLLWERYCMAYGINSLYENTHTLFGFIRERNAKKAIDWLNSSAYDTINGDRKIYS